MIFNFDISRYTRDTSFQKFLLILVFSIILTKDSYIFIYDLGYGLMISSLHAVR